MPTLPNDYTSLQPLNSPASYYAGYPAGYNPGPLNRVVTPAERAAAQSSIDAFSNSAPVYQNAAALNAGTPVYYFPNPSHGSMYLDTTPVTADGRTYELYDPRTQQVIMSGSSDADIQAMLARVNSDLNADPHNAAWSLRTAAQRNNLVSRRQDLSDLGGGVRYVGHGALEEVPTYDTLAGATPEPAGFSSFLKVAVPLAAAGLLAPLAFGGAAAGGAGGAAGAAGGAAGAAGGAAAGLGGITVPGGIGGLGTLGGTVAGSLGGTAGVAGTLGGAAAGLGGLAVPGAVGGLGAAGGAAAGLGGTLSSIGAGMGATAGALAEAAPLITVVGGGGGGLGLAGMASLAGIGVPTVATSLGSGLSSAGAATSSPGPTDAVDPNPITVSGTPPAPPVDVGAIATGVGSGLVSGAGSAVTGSAAQPPLETVDPNEIVVSGMPPAGVPAWVDAAAAGALGVGALGMSGGGLSAAEAEALANSSAANAGAGPVTAAPAASLTDKLSGYLGDAALLTGALGNLFGGKKSGTGNGTVPAGVSGMAQLQPVFSASLPSGSNLLPGGRGQVPNQMPAQDWNKYAFHPEQSFFSPKPLARGGLAGDEATGAPRGALPQGDGRSDNVPALLSPGEYVVDAETVALLGNGSNKAGAKALDTFRVNVRKHKGKALARGRISKNAKAPQAYMAGGLAYADK